MRLIIHGFEVLQDDVEGFRKLEGLFHALRLDGVTFETERVKNSFIEAVGNCQNITHMTVVSTDVLLIEKYLPPGGPYSVSKSLVWVHFNSVVLNVFRTRLISRALNYNTVLAEIRVKSPESARSDLVPLLTLSRPLHVLNLCGSTLSMAEYFTLYRRVKNTNQKAGLLLNQLHLELRDHHHEFSRRYFKLGVCLAEKRVIKYVNLYTKCVSRSEKRLVEYAEKVADFFLKIRYWL